MAKTISDLSESLVRGVAAENCTADFPDKAGGDLRPVLGPSDALCDRPYPYNAGAQRSALNYLLS